MNETVGKMSTLKVNGAVFGGLKQNVTVELKVTKQSANNTINSVNYP